MAAKICEKIAIVFSYDKDELTRNLITLLLLDSEFKFLIASITDNNSPGMVSLYQQYIFLKMVHKYQNIGRKKPNHVPQ